MRGSFPRRAWDSRGRRFGSKKTVIRAGFGMYYALIDNLSYRLDQNGPYNTVYAAKMSHGSEHLLHEMQTIPHCSKIIPERRAAGSSDADRDFLQVQDRAADSPNTTLSVGYIGSHGYHEILSIDANVPINVVFARRRHARQIILRARISITAACHSAHGTPALANPNVANTTHWFSEGVSSYNGLEVDVNHSFSHGLQFRGVYTFSKALDDGDSMNTSVATNSPAFARIR